MSVVIATYNRSNVLVYTLRSLLRSTFDDWDAIVVGDACTDDTADVVASFDDPRISFTNLPQNVGEQSGPNNEGVRLTSGRYVAYLNHDDLWFPDHLERLVATLEGTGADLVYALNAFYLSDGIRLMPNAAPGGRYVPDMSIPASCWLVRREVVDALGGWRRAVECHSVPSQDVLLRAHRAGRDIRLSPALTVVQINSVVRTGTYATRAFEEQAEHFARMTTDPGYRETLLTDCLLDAIDRHRRTGVRHHARGMAATPVRWLAARAGVTPRALAQMLTLRRRGAFVDRLRRERGLAPLDRRRRR